MDIFDTETCYTALTARDARFDGLFFVGVSTTGIYCRPVCPARTPRPERCTFFRTSAAAEREGFRACFRCRPELAPGAAPMDAIPRLAGRALRQIDEGALNDRSVAELAAGLGVSGRHLRRVVKRALGATPVELAQTRRLALAKQLLQDTELGLAEIAFASGFGSVRRFNDLFLERFGRAPSTWRERVPDDSGAHELSLRLDGRPPFDWPRLLGFLSARAIPGVEEVVDNVYRRVVRLGSDVGHVHVALDGRPTRLRVDVSLSLAGQLMPLVAGLRRLFDLDARPDVIAEALGSDPLIGALVRSRPGLRLPGSFDPFETTLRAILGQQVSVAAATTLSGRLVQALGEPLGPAAGGSLTHAFPTPGAVAGVPPADIASLGMPARRAESLHLVASAVASGELSLIGNGADWPAWQAKLVAIRGIGEWTAQYLAMRVLHRPDALPASDLVLRKALGGLDAVAVATRAESWRPWRAYAAMHLWTALAEGDLS